MGIDWHGMWVPDVNVVETFVRGTAVYLGLFTLFRVVLKRQSGTLGVGDLLVVVLIADATSNAMAKDYLSITNGLLLGATIIGWNYTLDWLGYHFRPLQQLFFPPPLRLVKDGKMLRRNMRAELITETELMAQVRLQGIERIEDVKEACMEGDGRISIVSHTDTQNAAPERKS